VSRREGGKLLQNLDKTSAEVEDPKPTDSDYPEFSEQTLLL
jgi:hypothetical protein